MLNYLHKLDKYLKIFKKYDELWLLQIRLKEIEAQEGINKKYMK